jgi:hypothetical protein
VGGPPIAYASRLHIPRFRWFRSLLDFYSALTMSAALTIHHNSAAVLATDEPAGAGAGQLRAERWVPECETWLLTLDVCCVRGVYVCVCGC